MKNISQNDISSLSNDQISLIYLYSDACKVCGNFYPTVEAMADKNPDVQFYKMNIMENMEYFATIKAEGVPFFSVQYGPTHMGGEQGASVEQLEAMIKGIKELKAAQCQAS